MIRPLACLVLAALPLWTSCTRDGPEPQRTDPLPSAPPAGAWTDDAELAFAKARCAQCHGPSRTTSGTIALGGVHGPERRILAPDWLAKFLPTHAKLDAAETAALIEVLTPAVAGETSITRVPASDFARGETLWRESGCAICHGKDGIAGLSAKTDVEGVAAYLREPRGVNFAPDSHRFPIRDDEARALAVWLVRDAAQGQPAVREPGLKVECFELAVRTPALPELAGLVPSRTARATRIDVSARTRDDEFALRFAGHLDVPRSGDWRFTLGSDDASWLWIDGELVIRNDAIAPHRRREARLRLEAGLHRIELVYTEARGGESLELLWEGPGQPQEEIGALALCDELVELRGPGGQRVVTPEAERRAGEIYVARACVNCHAGRVFGPSERRAKPWGELRKDSDCVAVAIPAVLRERIAEPLPVRAPREALAFALRREGCLACHAHAGSGGPDAAARALLVEREDLGEEGRLPPDLTDAGARLRGEWIESVLATTARVRPYVAVKKPLLGVNEAAVWARRFASAAGAVPDLEVKVDDATVAEGRRLAGSGGYACIACHRVAGRRSLGPQGMDLAEQFGRLQAHAMRSWLLAPNAHRPGTRMPSFFPADTPQAREQIAALTAWMSLGDGMALPDGIVTEAGAWRLDVTDRPRLHGAFLKGLSARCIAVATPQRVNWAYDLAHARFAWLWRGEFLDTSGTWDGRAGRVLEPLGEDFVQMPDVPGFVLETGESAPLRVTGWSLDPEGHPVFHLKLGEIAIDDAPRPRLQPGGAILVRRITARGGAVRVNLPPDSGPLRSDPPFATVVPDGQTKEITYRW